MKNLYRVTNKNGVTLCFQVAASAKEAIEFAYMYGHRDADNASPPIFARMYGYKSATRA